MPKTKTITIRVPIETYYKFLGMASNNEKPISTYLNEILQSSIGHTTLKDGSKIETKSPPEWTLQDAEDSIWNPKNKIIDNSINARPWPKEREIAFENKIRTYKVKHGEEELEYDTITGKLTDKGHSTLKQLAKRM